MCCENRCEAVEIITPNFLTFVAASGVVANKFGSCNGVHTMKQNTEIAESIALRNILSKAILKIHFHYGFYE